MPMRKFIIYSSGFAMLFFTSCLNFLFIKNSNLWFYTYSNGEIPKEFTLTPASFLFLNPDKTYTLDFGKFEYGKWEKDEDSLILNSAQGTTQKYLINYKSSKDLKLTIEPGVVSDFTGSGSSFSSESANPFSIQNNKWRIPASHKETSPEIKQRLINHCAFWKAYFAWALDNNIGYVDVRSTPSPFKIYGNGFALKEFNDLPAIWKNYFYDSSDCVLANNMIKDVLTKNNIAWAQTDSKYKMFMGAFEQLESFFKKE
jgi:hypothetical protein